MQGVGRGGEAVQGVGRPCRGWGGRAGGGEAVQGVGRSCRGWGGSA